MNWYSLFYWIMVADGLKSTFDAFSNLFMVFFVLSSLVVLGMGIFRATEYQNMEDNEQRSFNGWWKGFKRFSMWSASLCLITWTLWVAIPSKRDALTIVAGGAVGNFITSDSSAKQIPAEAMSLLREKIKAEIKDLQAPKIMDTLSTLSREELIDRLKKKS